MTTTWEESGAGAVREAVRDLLEDIKLVPDFGPLRTDDYREGYSAARNDVVPIVDARLGELMDVYIALEIAQTLFSGGGLGEFLTRRIPTWGDKTPVERMASGEAAAVIELLAAEYEGQVG